MSTAPDPAPSKRPLLVAVAVAVVLLLVAGAALLVRSRSASAAGTPDSVRQACQAAAQAKASAGLAGPQDPQAMTAVVDGYERAAALAREAAAQDDRWSPLSVALASLHDNAVAYAALLDDGSLAGDESAVGVLRAQSQQPLVTVASECDALD